MVCPTGHLPTARAGRAAAQTSPSLRNVIQKVRGDVSIRYAMRVMRDVYASDRFFTFPAFMRLRNT